MQTYTLNLDIKKFLIKVFEDNNIKKYHFVQHDDQFCKLNGLDVYHNRCCIVGNDQIFVGIYNDPQLMVIGALHQVGHTTVDNQDILETVDDKCKAILMIQHAAWHEALKLLDSYGIIVSDKMLNYIEGCLETYKYSQKFDGQNAVSPNSNDYSSSGRNINYNNYMSSGNYIQYRTPNYTTAKAIWEIQFSNKENIKRFKSIEEFFNDLQGERMMIEKAFKGLYEAVKQYKQIQAFIKRRYLQKNGLSQIDYCCSKIKDIMSDRIEYEVFNAYEGVAVPYTRYLELDQILMSEEDWKEYLQNIS